MPKRNGIRLVALMLGAALGNAHAHGNTSGPLNVESWIIQSGTSGGVYQYQLFWAATGQGHNAYNLTLLQSAPTNLGPWTQWQRVSGHFGDVYPAPLGVWHRAKFCHWTGCLISLRSKGVWTPRQLCESGGGPALH